MTGQILFVLLIAESFNIMEPVTIEPQSVSVSVRTGEPLHLSCDIHTRLGEHVEESYWIRNGNMRRPYGTVNVSTCQPNETAPCAKNETLDSRGTVKYFYNTNRTANTTLEIEKSSSEDNTTFYCSVKKQSDGRQGSEDIYVSVYSLPSVTTPNCTSSNSSGVSVPSSLTCSAGESQPGVSLEWATSGEDSGRLSLSNLMKVVEDRVENTLDLTTLQIPGSGLVFTCSMRSWAYPEFVSNCSIEVPIIPATDETMTRTRTPSAVTDQSVSLSRPVTVIAATAGAGGAFFILIAIISCVVSPRKPRKRRGVAARFRAGQQNDVVRLATDTPTYENSITVSVPYRGNYDRVPLEDDTSSDHAGLQPQVYAYASVAPAHRQPTTCPLPQYTVLDPDVEPEKICNNHAYASVEARQERSGDAASKSSWEDEHPQDQESLRLKPLNTRATYTEIQPINDSGVAGEDDNALFVDNILYVRSTDDIIGQTEVKGQPVA